MTETTASAETFSDTLMGFTLPGRSARGRVVRMEGVLEEVLRAHDYPAPITHLLSEALVLGALEWLRTLTVLAMQRQHAGIPWLRMAIILGVVAALALVAAWLFQTPRLAQRFGLGGRHPG